MTHIRVESAAAAHEMPAEYREILIHQLLVHTEGELSGADAYRQGFLRTECRGTPGPVCVRR